MMTSDGLDEIQEIQKTYERCEFPEEKHDTVFSTTTIYWKDTDEAKEEEEIKEGGKSKGKVKEESDSAENKAKDEDELSKKLESTTISE